MATRTTKAKKISIEPKGISALYRECPTCEKLRKGRKPFLINHETTEQCPICYGIAWQREWRKSNKRKKVAVK